MLLFLSLVYYSSQLSPFLCNRATLSVFDSPDSVAFESSYSRPIRTNFHLSLVVALCSTFSTALHLVSPLPAARISRQSHQEVEYAQMSLGIEVSVEV